MSKAGQNNYKGINAQTLTAASLFLQFFRDKSLSHIHLESDNLEDFDLVFNDGRKIICESKYRKEKLSFSELKEILEKIAKRGGLGDKDDILIICKNISKEFISEVKNTKYFEGLRDKFKKKGFTDDTIHLLPRVEFWVGSAAFNSDTIHALLGELVNFWLPADEIKRFIDSVLIQKINEKSAQGQIYERRELLQEIDDFKNQVQQSSDFFNKKTKKEKQFLRLEKDINNANGINWGTGSISAFSTRWDLMSFAMDRLKTRNDLDLKKWDDLWQLNRVYYFTFGIFHVFENNLQTDKNRKYVLNYIKRYTKTIRGFYRSDFFDVDVVKIVTKIIEGAGGIKYFGDAFTTIKDLIIFDKKEFFYLKDSGYNHGEWEKGEICKLLHKIYTSADKTLKQKIFNLIVTAFNITEDDGEFSRHTPKEVYEIIHNWLEEDFVNKFKTLVEIIANQYGKFYRKFSKKMVFDGWEHMGGGISIHGDYLGSNYHISERHFVSFILAPAIKKFYDENNEVGWQFIKENCLNKTDSKTKNKFITKNISKNRPDFLNRAVYEIVLNRYASSDRKVSDEAFEILREFILSRKGIPHKADLIYQSVADSGLLNDKKWNLVNLTIEKYKTPINPFVEHIVVNLAKNSHVKARDTIKSWFKDNNYYDRYTIEREAIPSIRAFIEEDLDFAIGLFTDRINSNSVKNGKEDHFEAYSDAALLNDILKKDFKKGLSIFRIIEKEAKLSKNLQIIYCYGLFNSHGNDDSDDINLLMSVYNEIIDPFLKKYSNVTNISERISMAVCREAFVQFAVRLAVKKQTAEAIRIIQIFIDDPDPYLPGRDPDDPENKYNEHKKIEEGQPPTSITSVRGWCGWALMKCSILEGRKYLEEIITLSKKLSEDENYYVVHMSCFALSQLGRNRLTVLPTDKDILFFDDNKETALKRSKKVEKISFDVLSRLASWPKLVQKAMAKSILTAFDQIRSLNEQDSLKLLNTLAKLHSDAVGEAAPLFIYFSEFRKDSYINWRFSAPGLYDDLGPEKYDDKKFKKITENTIKSVQQYGSDNCFKFASSAEHLMREASEANVEEYTEIAFKYFELLSDIYNHGIFNLFYMTIENKLSQSDKYLKRWFSFLIKCLKIETAFYNQKKKEDKMAEVYWYPSLYHSRILELVYEKLGKDKFIEAARIVFSFPDKMDLHESTNLVSIIQELAKKNKEAKKFIKALIDKNPSKYWELRKSK